MARILKNLACFVMIVSAQPTFADEEWRFCVSANFATRRAYLTDAFRSGDSRETLEGWYRTTLLKKDGQIQAAQCPTPGDPLQIEASRDHAERFLRQFGFHIFPVHVSGSAGS